MLMRTLLSVDKKANPDPEILSMLMQLRSFTGPQRQRENS